MMISIPKGTKDVLPYESYKIQYVEAKARAAAAVFCFKEIRTPVFEHTEVFQRGIGDGTDIVNKEMYTFLDKGERSITLKPEGTAGVARSFLENSLYAQPQPVKMYYISPIFRYERPQAGRLREHHQFGCELFGSPNPEADVEVISLARCFLNSLGIDKLLLKINSIGCPECRKSYGAALKAYLAERLSSVCPTCRDRFEKNPLRILDCKEDACKKITAGAPSVIEYLCADCASHFDGVKAGLAAAGISYETDPKIVRGLDYYNRTVFEFVSSDIGAQGTVCGGGRYDGLAAQLGGAPCPAVGFGLGLERLLLTLENAGLLNGVSDATPDYYIAAADPAAKAAVSAAAAGLRAKGCSVETDLMGRSVRAQMKFADKRGARRVIVIGGDELASGFADVKDMQSGASVKVRLSEL
ncbi:MAG: histidine--tRNA ligase [Clostridiales bacterium]|jgi:histidyl-tRNA synthetase|nr:histidine--tRNA ligase [Clostridiales bacterium]